MKLKVLSVVVVAVTAVMLAVSSLSGAQEALQQYEQYPLDIQPAATDVQSPSATGLGIMCAPWSKEWSLADGQWVYDWYRWCVDTSLYDPAVESSWEREWGAREVHGQANLCPEKGTCTMTPGGGMKMSTNTP